MNENKYENEIISNIIIGNHNQSIIKQAEKILNSANKDCGNTHHRLRIKVGNEIFDVPPNEHIEVINYSWTYFEED